MKKSKQITSHAQLIAKKQQLRLVMADQQEQLQTGLIQLKEAFWPFEMLNRFKGNLQGFASNGMVAVGIELAKLIIQYFLSRKNESAPNGDVIKNFIANIVAHFIKNKEQQTEGDSPAA